MSHYILAGGLKVQSLKQEYQSSWTPSESQSLGPILGVLGKKN